MAHFLEGAGSIRKAGSHLHSIVEGVRITKGTFKMH